jgi:hypothetical protein
LSLNNGKEAVFIRIDCQWRVNKQML